MTLLLQQNRARLIEVRARADFDRLNANTTANNCAADIARAFLNGGEFDFQPGTTLASRIAKGAAARAAADHAAYAAAVLDSAVAQFDAAVAAEAEAA